MLLKIQRKYKTADAFMGEMWVEGEKVCYSMERCAVAIPEGLYKGHMEKSPHFKMATPHLDIPYRTLIEIHPANYPGQLEGCIACGSAIDGDAIDNSRAAFERLVANLPQTFDVLVIGLH